jgi:mRNA interferase MazF
MRRIVTYKRYDVVKVPFPFTDKLATKTRPALVLSEQTTFNRQVGHSVLAMITTAKQSTWALDSVITDLTCAGLPAPSIVRMKLFTLDDRLIIARLGELADDDKQTVEQNLKALLGLTIK